MLNNELEKQQQLLKQLIDASIKREFMEGKHPGSQQQQELLIINLKRELDSALKSLSLKETEFKTLQKTTKVTKFKEVEVIIIKLTIKRKRKRPTCRSASGCIR